MAQIEIWNKKVEQAKSYTELVDILLEIPSLVKVATKIYDKVNTLSTDNKINIDFIYLMAYQIPTEVDKTPGSGYRGIRVKLADGEIFADILKRYAEKLKQGNVFSAESNDWVSGIPVDVSFLLSHLNDFDGIDYPYAKDLLKFIYGYDFNAEEIDVIFGRNPYVASTQDANHPEASDLMPLEHYVKTFRFYLYDNRIAEHYHELRDRYLRKVRKEYISNVIKQQAELIYLKYMEPVLGIDIDIDPLFISIYIEQALEASLDDYNCKKTIEVLRRFNHNIILSDEVEKSFKREECMREMTAALYRIRNMYFMPDTGTPKDRRNTTIDLDYILSKGTDDEDTSIATEAHDPGSSKLDAASRKIYAGYKAYKDNENKVDSQLTKLALALKRQFTGQNPKEKVLGGEQLSVVKVLKKILGTAAVFSFSKVAGILFIIVKFFTSNRATAKARREVLQELELEMRLLDEKIDDARSDGNKQAKYALIRTRGELEKAYDQIRYGMTAGEKARATAKDVISGRKSTSYQPSRSKND